MTLFTTQLASPKRVTISALISVPIKRRQNALAHVSLQKLCQVIPSEHLSASKSKLPALNVLPVFILFTETIAGEKMSVSIL